RFPPSHSPETHRYARSQLRPAARIQISQSEYLRKAAADPSSHAATKSCESSSLQTADKPAHREPAAKTPNLRARALHDACIRRSGRSEPVRRKEQTPTAALVLRPRQSMQRAGEAPAQPTRLCI